MDTNDLETALEAILGHPVLILTECGLAVYDRSTLRELLSLRKAPAKLTAETLAAKIVSKQANTEAAKVRREAAIQAIKAKFEELGLPTSAAYYPTSFGFSVCNLFGDGLTKARQIIEGAGIQHKRLEYSLAHWVVRVHL